MRTEVEAQVYPNGDKTRRIWRRASTAGRRAVPKRWRRRVLATFGALLVAIPAAGGAGWWYLNYRLGQVHHVKIASGLLHVSKPGAPFNILLIGSDSRQFESSSGQSSHFGSSSVVTGQRSDVVIVARVVPETRQVYLLSIPRDLWVDIPGNVPYISGQNRINAAFNSGPSLLIETLKKDLGIPIDHFAEVTFAGFSGMVDAVGGIRIDFPEPVKDTYTGLSIRHTGCQLVNGGMALAYVRSRHLQYEQDGTWNYDGMSDWSRIRRQDVFFHALLDRVRSKVTNVIDMNDLLGAVVRNLTVDSTLSNSDLIGLGLQFRHASSGSIHTEVLPTVPEVLPSGADVLLPAQSYDQAMIAKFLAIGTASSARKDVREQNGGRSLVGTPGSSTTATSPSSVTSTTTPAGSSSGSSGVVFDTQPEPWNGTPC
ncbi:MAG: LCP family protein [Acidimicrobiales bacterium]